MLKSAEDTARIKPLSLKLGLVNISWSHLSCNHINSVSTLRSENTQLPRIHTCQRPQLPVKAAGILNTRESLSGRASDTMLEANERREHTL